MRRTTILFLTLILSALMGCSSELGGPVTNGGPADNTEPDKRITFPDLNGPLSFDMYLSLLSNTFNTISWVDTEVTLPVRNGGTVSVLPAGYPVDHPVSITIPPNPSAAAEFEKGTISVPAPLPAGAFLEVPGDCLIYRTVNIPPVGTKTATIDLPIMPWNRTDSFSGIFTTYDLHPVTEDSYEARNLETVQIPWVPDGSETTFVQSVATLDKDVISHAIDHVTDPDEPGEEE